VRAQLDNLTKIRFTQAEYDEAKNQRDFECLKIAYSSGGLRITGFIYKPKHTSGQGSRRAYPRVVPGAHALTPRVTEALPPLDDMRRRTGRGESDEMPARRFASRGDERRRTTGRVRSGHHLHGRR